MSGEPTSLPAETSLAIDQFIAFLLENSEDLDHKIIATLEHKVLEKPAAVAKYPFVAPENLWNKYYVAKLNDKRSSLSSGLQSIGSTSPMALDRSTSTAAFPIPPSVPPNATPEAAVGVGTEPPSDVLASSQQLLSFLLQNSKDLNATAVAGLEKKLFEKPGAAAKYGFLSPQSPWNAWWRAKLDQERKERGFLRTNLPSSPPSEASATTSSSPSSSTLPPAVATSKDQPPQTVIDAVAQLLATFKKNVPTGDAALIQKLEARVLERAGKDAGGKFAFLVADNQHRPYYLSKLYEVFPHLAPPPPAQPAEEPSSSSTLSTPPPPPPVDPTVESEADKQSITVDQQPASDQKKTEKQVSTSSVPSSELEKSPASEAESKPTENQVQHSPSPENKSAPTVPTLSVHQTTPRPASITSPSSPATTQPVVLSSTPAVDSKVQPQQTSPQPETEGCVETQSQPVSAVKPESAVGGYPNAPQPADPKDSTALEIVNPQSVPEPTAPVESTEAILLPSQLEVPPSATSEPQKVEENVEQEVGTKSTSRKPSQAVKAKITQILSFLLANVSTWSEVQEFEQSMILVDAQGEGEPEYGFLNPSDPDYAYYQGLLVEALRIAGKEIPPSAVTNTTESINLEKEGAPEGESEKEEPSESGEILAESPPPPPAKSGKSGAKAATVTATVGGDSKSKKSAPRSETPTMAKTAVGIKSQPPPAASEKKTLSGIATNKTPKVEPKAQTGVAPSRFTPSPEPSLKKSATGMSAKSTLSKAPVPKQTTGAKKAPGKDDSRSSKASERTQKELGASETLAEEKDENFVGNPATAGKAARLLGMSPQKYMLETSPTRAKRESEVAKKSVQEMEISAEEAHPKPETETRPSAIEVQSQPTSPERKEVDVQAKSEVSDTATTASTPPSESRPLSSPLVKPKVKMMGISAQIIVEEYHTAPFVPPSPAAEKAARLLGMSPQKYMKETSPARAKRDAEVKKEQPQTEESKEAAMSSGNLLLDQVPWPTFVKQKQTKDQKQSAEQAQRGRPTASTKKPETVESKPPPPPPPQLPTENGVTEKREGEPKLGFSAPMTSGLGENVPENVVPQQQPPGSRKGSRGSKRAKSPEKKKPVLSISTLEQSAVTTVSLAPKKKRSKSKEVELGNSAELSPKKGKKRVVLSIEDDRVSEDGESESEIESPSVTALKMVDSPRLDNSAGPIDPLGPWHSSSTSGQTPKSPDNKKKKGKGLKSGSPTKRPFTAPNPGDTLAVTVSLFKQKGGRSRSPSPSKKPEKERPKSREQTSGDGSKKKKKDRGRDRDRSGSPPKGAAKIGLIGDDGEEFSVLETRQSVDCEASLKVEPEEDIPDQSDIEDPQDSTTTSQTADPAPVDPSPQHKTPPRSFAISDTVVYSITPQPEIATQFQNQLQQNGGNVDSFDPSVFGLFENEQQVELSDDSTKHVLRQTGGPIIVLSLPAGASAQDIQKAIAITRNAVAQPPPPPPPPPLPTAAQPSDHQPEDLDNFEFPPLNAQESPKSQLQSQPEPEVEKSDDKVEESPSTPPPLPPPSSTNNNEDDDIQSEPSISFKISDPVPILDYGDIPLLQSDPSAPGERTLTVPREIKDDVDQVVAFVCDNADSWREVEDFEKGVLNEERQKHNGQLAEGFKFSFLDSQNEWFWYYRQTLQKAMQDAGKPLPPMESPPPRPLSMNKKYHAKPSYISQPLSKGGKELPPQTSTSPTKRPAGVGENSNEKAFGSGGELFWDTSRPSNLQAKIHESAGEEDSDISEYVISSGRRASFADVNWKDSQSYDETVKALSGQSAFASRPNSCAAANISSRQRRRTSGADNKILDREDVNALDSFMSFLRTSMGNISVENFDKIRKKLGALMEGRDGRPLGYHEYFNVVAQVLVEFEQEKLRQSSPLPPPPPAVETSQPKAFGEFSTAFTSSLPPPPPLSVQTEMQVVVAQHPTTVSPHQRSAPSPPPPPLSSPPSLPPSPAQTPAHVVVPSPITKPQPQPSQPEVTPTTPPKPLQPQSTSTTNNNSPPPPPPLPISETQIVARRRSSTPAPLEPTAVSPPSPPYVQVQLTTASLHSPAQDAHLKKSSPLPASDLSFPSVHFASENIVGSNPPDFPTVDSSLTSLLAQINSVGAGILPPRSDPSFERHMGGGGEGFQRPRAVTMPGLSSTNSFVQSLQRSTPPPQPYSSFQQSGDYMSPIPPLAPSAAESGYILKPVLRDGQITFSVVADQQQNPVSYSPSSSQQSFFNSQSVGAQTPPLTSSWPPRQPWLPEVEGAQKQRQRENEVQRSQERKKEWESALEEALERERRREERSYRMRREMRYRGDEGGGGEDYSPSPISTSTWRATRKSGLRDSEVSPTEQERQSWQRSPPNKYGDLGQSSLFPAVGVRSPAGGVQSSFAAATSSTLRSTAAAAGNGFREFLPEIAPEDALRRSRSHLAEDSSYYSDGSVKRGATNSFGRSSSVKLDERPSILDSYMAAAGRSSGGFDFATATSKFGVSQGQPLDEVRRLNREFGKPIMATPLEELKRMQRDMKRSKQYKQPTTF